MYNDGQTINFFTILDIMYPGRKCVNECVDYGNSEPSHFTVTVTFVTQPAATESNNPIIVQRFYDLSYCAA